MGASYLYPSPNIIGIIKSRRMRWVGDVACTREMRNTFKTLAGKLERERPLERPTNRWENNIKKSLKK
jgi:hypothetical protein